MRWARTSSRTCTSEFILSACITCGLSFSLLAVVVFFFFCHKIVSISLLCTVLNSVVWRARAEKCIVTVYLLTVLLFSRPSAIFTYLTTLVPMISKYHSCKPEYHTLANTHRYFSGLFAVLPHSKTSKKITVLLQ